AAGVIADADFYLQQVLRRANGAVVGDVDAGLGDGVGVAPHHAVAGGAGHVDGPMASAGDVAGAAGLHGLQGARHHGRRGAVGGLHAGIGIVGVLSPDGGGLGEDVVQALVCVVALLLGDPLLQAAVRHDAELRHIGQSSSGGYEVTGGLQRVRV